jgi:uncharacterized membrane protein
LIIFKYLHILSMFSAVGLVVGTDLLLHRVADSADVRAIRTTFALFKPINSAIPVMFALGLIFGLITAFTGQMNFLAPWLILSYIVFGLTFAVGGIAGRWTANMAEAAAASPDDGPSADLTALINQRAPRVTSYLGFLAVIVIVFLMVVKPFS